MFKLWIIGLHRNANLIFAIMQENFHLSVQKVYQQCEVKTTHAEEVP
jgi:hypothetical protein